MKLSMEGIRRNKSGESFSACKGNCEEKGKHCCTQLRLWYILKVSFINLKVNESYERDRWEWNDMVYDFKIKAFLLSEKISKIIQVGYQNH